MSNYREEEITGSKWRRSHFVSIENPLVGEKAVTFHEQMARQTSDGELQVKDAGSLRQSFDDPSVVFDLRSPLDDSLLGATATYQDVYVILHSLYLHLASQRDGVTLT
jgi:hypothetical protein